jgi:hypothetical protein
MWLNDHKDEADDRHYHPRPCLLPQKKEKRSQLTTKKRPLLKNCDWVIPITASDGNRWEKGRFLFGIVGQNGWDWSRPHPGQRAPLFLKVDTRGYFTPIFDVHLQFIDCLFAYFDPECSERYLSAVSHQLWPSCMAVGCSMLNSIAEGPT